jgi:hypothetical protein
MPSFVSMLDEAEPEGPDELSILRNEVTSLNNLLEESAHALQAINDQVVPSRLQNLQWYTLHMFVGRYTVSFGTRA